MKISDTPFYKTTPLFYQPLPFYRKNLTPSLFAKISKSQLLLFIKEGVVPTMFKFWVGVWVLEIFARRGFNGTFHKFWIIFKKVSHNSIMPLHLYDRDEWNMQSCSCCSVAIESRRTNPSWTSSATKWLPCRKDIEPTKIKDLNFDREDFAQIKRKDFF